jgi:hypothetical protein
MKLTTKQSITFEDWINQVKRFADYEYNIINATLPKDTATGGKAEIKLTINTLTYPKFDGVVEYVQNWETLITVPNFETATGEQNGTKEVIQKHSKVVLAYKLQKNYEEIQAILDAVDPLINPDLTGKARLEAKVMKAVVLDVVGHHTFTTTEHPNGLPESEYEISI